MGILLVVAFISGLVTILAPCIWPLLPIVLSTSTGGGRGKSLGITLGVISSFFVLTLSISTLVRLFGFDPNILRLVAVLVLGILGMSLVVPAFSFKLEALVSKLSGSFGSRLKSSNNGFIGGFTVGIALGIVWTPCAGPILATIATLAATQSVNLQAVLVTLVYVIGVGIPLFIFSFGASWFFEKSKFVGKYTGRIQQIFGILMVLTALAIYTNYDKVIQTKLLDLFPSYTNLLTSLETKPQVQNQLNDIRGGETSLATGSDLKDLGPAPDFVGINNWLNSQPLKMADLKGKVVLVDFWTYTCINCVRTLPYVTSWYDKYHDKGFVVVGVHTPEFEFEKNTQNVANAIMQYKINYPVAQDNDYATWTNYKNQYWPAKYLIDANGRLRMVHFGEGNYEETEKAIQQLLAESGQNANMDLSQFTTDQPSRLTTPETYLGLKRLESFASNEEPAQGTREYTASGHLGVDKFAYQGKWDIEEEYAQASAGSVLELNFTANKVYLVTTPGGDMGKFKVLIDGKAVDVNSAGVSVKDGVVEVGTSNLFNLVDLKGKVGQHILRLEFETDGVKVFAFTFG
ncbi:MAG TPA: cytochrome c biogenesis protein DipZ [Candidatus Saccharimonadales bacterium]|nr:cytochrome c biogenesis protein DipZ [Candidatus Saccharimonadales bacterium]